MSSIHLEILDKKRQETFKKLQPFSKRGYLAGGTALTLLLAHRKSFDFDIFLPKTIDNKLKDQIKKVFPSCKFELNTSDQLNLTTLDGIKITFLWYYFPTLKPLIKEKDCALPLASIEDIAADKAYTIGRRAAWRDYVDLFFILNEGVFTLSQLIKLTSKKFKEEFNISLFLDQLVYFNDLEITKIEFIKKSHTPKEIKEFLENEVIQYLKQFS